MAVVTAVVGFDQRVDASATANRLAQRASIHPSLETEQLLASRNFAAFGLLPGPARDGGRLRISRPDATSVVIGGPGHVHTGGHVIANELSSPGSATQDLPIGRWIALRQDPNTGTVRALVDPLGQGWVYVASIPGGVMLSSDLAALVSEYPTGLTLNEEATLAQLALGFTPSDDTCLREVSMLPPGTVVELSGDGISQLSQYQMPYGDTYAGLSTSAKYERIDAILASSLDTWADGDYSDVVLSLSGGNDSTMALAGLLQKGLKPRSLTWGYPSSRDARVPRQLSERLGFPWRLIESPQPTWPSWLKALQSVGALGTDWAGWADAWLEQLANGATGVIAGSAGDAITGKNIRPPDDGLDGDWVAKWRIRAYQEDRWHNSGLLRPEARRRLPEAVMRQADVRLAKLDVAFPFQRYIHIDLYGRQRRLTGGQTNQIARVMAPLPFLQTREMLDFWLNLPWSDFGDQKLYLDYARERHAAIFDIVLGERDVDLTSARRAPRRVSRALRLRLAGRFPGMRKRLATTNNDLLGIQMQFRTEIVDIVRQAEPLLEPLLDTAALRLEMDNFPRTRLLSPFRLMNLLGVAAHVALATDQSAHSSP